MIAPSSGHCLKTGCPGWGTRDEHVRNKIGAPDSFEAYGGTYIVQRQVGLRLEALLIAAGKDLPPAQAEEAGLLVDALRKGRQP